MGICTLLCFQCGQHVAAGSSWPPAEWQITRRPVAREKQNQILDQSNLRNQELTRLQISNGVLRSSVSKMVLGSFFVWVGIGLKMTSKGLAVGRGAGDGRRLLGCAALLVATAN